jgi:hypothetical protein
VNLLLSNARFDPRKHLAAAHLRFATPASQQPGSDRAEGCAGRLGDGRRGAESPTAE